MKTIRSTLLWGVLGVFLFISQAHAVDVNFNLLNVTPPSTSVLQQTYSNDYGFTPDQVAPVMLAPAPEVPTILQIAKSAGTMPLSIWAMRKMGFSYMDILKTYTLPPTTFYSPVVPYERFGPTLVPIATYQNQYGGSWPSTVVLEDPAIIELGKIKYFTDYRRIPITRIISLPTDPIYFNHLVVTPWGRSPYFIPPGQEKKYWERLGHREYGRIYDWKDRDYWKDHDHDWKHDRDWKDHDHDWKHDRDWKDHDRGGKDHDHDWKGHEQARKDHDSGEKHHDHDGKDHDHGGKDHDHGGKDHDHGGGGHDHGGGNHGKH